MNSQCARILAHLRIATIDPMHALKYAGCWRLGARIYDLRKLGHKIDTEIVTVTNNRGEVKRVAMYRLRREKK